MFKNHSIHNIFIFISYGICFALGLLVQQHVLFSNDVSWLLHATKKMMHDGHYYYDFFETNPPMILYLYIPAVWLAHIVGISLMTASRYYTSFMALLSLGVCNYFFKKIFRINAGLNVFLIFTLIFVYMYFPSSEFGQREHLTLMFTLPYVFLLGARIQKQPVPLLLVILIGVTSGVGFLIKPFFLIPLCLLELYCLYQSKNILACIRTETVIIVLLAILYLLSIFIITPEYIHKILPLIVSTYYDTVSQHWLGVLAPPVLFFTVFCWIFYFIFRHEIKEKVIADLISIASIGFMFSYIIQKTIWYYHILPTFSLSTLLLVITIYNILSQHKSHDEKKYYYFLSFFILLILCLLLSRKLYVGYKNLNASHFITLKNLIKKEAKNKNIFIFTSCRSDAYPLIDYTHSHSASRYPELFFTVSVLNPSPISVTDRQRLKKVLFNTTIQDLQKGKPTLLLVKNETKRPACLLDNTFEYIHYFSQDKQFQIIMKHYRKTGAINHFTIYKRMSKKDG